MRHDIDASTVTAKHQGLHGEDKEFIIFYDETNNIRKLLLTEAGLNVKKHDNFVLGGIAIEPGESIGDIEDLRTLLRIQKTAEEIKFDLVAKGDFEHALDSRKLGQVFTWLVDRNIKIHYSNLNILNWSILDIIDSIIANDKFMPYALIHRELKNELYRVVTSALPVFLSILKNYSFPNIERSKTSDFIGDVRNFIKRFWPSKALPPLRILDDLLRQAGSLPELAFLVDERPDYLIDGFEHVFLSRICTFKNSKHVFDEERKIQAAIKDIRVMNGEREVDFSFVDSKQVAGIQLSDVIVGFLGKYFTFIEKTPMSVLLRKQKGLTRTQSSNLNLLRQLVDISDISSNALLHRTTTMDSDWKNDSFLHGKKPPPHLLDS